MQDVLDRRKLPAIENKKRVEDFMKRNLCASQTECARALGLALMTVNRAVREIRAEWRERA